MNISERPNNNSQVLVTQGIFNCVHFGGIPPAALRGFDRVGDGIIVKEVVLGDEGDCRKERWTFKNTSHQYRKW
jgi:hypothetical protein